MKYIQQKRVHTRASILKLLTDAEVARVLRAGTGQCLRSGDEYVDLNQLDRGVRRVGRKMSPTGLVLARKGVAESTWLEITEQLLVLSRTLLN